MQRCWLGIVALMLVAGCGSSDDSGGPAGGGGSAGSGGGSSGSGCLYETPNSTYCMTRVDVPGFPAATCKSLGFTPVAACPADGLIGICRSVSNMDETWDQYYYKGDANQQSCEQGNGTWRTTP